MIDDITKYERNICSRDGADGILEMIFNEIGTTNKYFVEFGAWGHGDNALHLYRHKQWTGLWMDGKGNGTSIKKERITAENINELFLKYQVPKCFDLLSIDMDSNDYWIWKALDYCPRIVVIEYNACLPAASDLIVEYDPNLTWDGSDYFGASLLALTKLAAQKGYKLIGCDKTGANAYFCLNELGEKFKGGTAQEMYHSPAYKKYPKSNRWLFNTLIP